MKFEILGIPFSKQSARFHQSKGKLVSYQSKKIIVKENAIKISVTNQLPPGFIPFDCPLSLKCEYIFPIPSNFSKKKRKQLQEGKRFWKATRPDIDSNLNKGLVDALEGILFVNDSRIVKMEAEKYYGETPKMIIEILPII